MIKTIMAAVAALSLAAVPVAAQDGNDRRIRVMNYSNSNYIVSVSLTNEHGRTYELLRPNTITPGYNRVLNFDDGEGHSHCVYSIQARFANGVYARRNNVNVCVRYQWRIADLDNDIQ